MAGDPTDVIARFAIEGVLLDARPLGLGHIHEPFVSTWDRGGARERYVHQRLNTSIFERPSDVMENVVRVTEHLRAKLAARAAPDAERRCLSLVRAADGATLVEDAAGAPSRTYRYV